MPKKQLAALVLLAATVVAQATPVVICEQGNTSPSCNVYSLSTENRNAASNVAEQAQAKGPAILYAGSKERKTEVMEEYPNLLVEAANYPNKFPWVYLYDEAGWCGTICEFKDEDLAIYGAHLARSAGMSAMISILPDVILDDRFTMKDINAFDGIAIDVYPSMRPTSPDFKGCRFSSNPMENLFYCSVQKLREYGFTGRIGYIYQAFGLDNDTPEYRWNYLQVQQEAVSHAEAMGADAIMPWGCILSKEALEREPYLVPLCGTAYEPLLQPR